MIVLRLFVIFALIAINAFFAAVEFSLVAVRHSRVRQLVEQGDSRARIVERLIADMGMVISGVQVGITLTSLALGYLGEVTLANFLAPFFAGVPGRYAPIAEHALALLFAFALLTALQVVLGELVPKSLSLAHAERVALLVARPFRWFLRTFRWAILLLNAIAGKFVEALGVKMSQSHSAVRSAEELRILIEQAGERGVLEPVEERFLQGAMNLGNVQVREIMVPRPDIHALPSNAGLEDVMKIIAITQRSRIPVYDGNLDHVIGFVHIKDLIWVLLDRARRAEEHQPPAEFQLRHMLREVLIVPETKPAIELLLELRAHRTGLAMAVDEFGTILGLVTLEDILEQMVGEIHDEFDVVEHPLHLDDGSMIFDASLNIRDLEGQFHIELPENPAYETLAGYVLTQLGFLPRGGETFEDRGYRFTIVEMEGRRIARVKIKRLDDADAGAALAEKPKSAPASPSAKHAAHNRSRPARSK
ncbi:MAG TPA: hemolysin family protein [Candidatus Limnocylindrales bacterium]|nr:hemolysin family protein [Candidatus Limnocylindrales bacterium]